MAAARRRLNGAAHARRDDERLLDERVVALQGGGHPRALPRADDRGVPQLRTRRLHGGDAAQGGVRVLAEFRARLVVAWPADIGGAVDDPGRFRLQKLARGGQHDVSCPERQRLGTDVVG